MIRNTNLSDLSLGKLKRKVGIDLIVSQRLTESPEAMFDELYKGTEFETDYWFTGQLFSPDWKPPRTEYD
jgi:hypothetical protein